MFNRMFLNAKEYKMKQTRTPLHRFTFSSRGLVTPVENINDILPNNDFRGLRSDKKGPGTASTAIEIRSKVLSCISFEQRTLARYYKSVNLEYNMLVRWADGTNELSTKSLTFQVFYFSYLSSFL